MKPNRTTIYFTITCFLLILGLSPGCIVQKIAVLENVQIEQIEMEEPPNLYRGKQCFDLQKEEIATNKDLLGSKGWIVRTDSARLWETYHPCFRD